MRRLMLLSAVLLGGLTWALRPQKKTSDLPVVSAGATIAPLGPTRDYQVVAQAETTATLVQDSTIQARLDLRGALTVTPIEQVEDGLRVELRWRPRTLEWTGVGATADSSDTQAALARHPIRATWQTDGRMTDFSYPADAPGAVASLTELVLGELALPLVDALPVQTGFGLAQTRVAARPTHAVVTRSGADYLHIDGVPPDLTNVPVLGEGRGTIHTDALGLVESTFQESLHTQDEQLPDGQTHRWATAFKGTLRRVGTRSVAAPTAWDGVPRHRLIGAAERRALEGRVGHLTATRLITQLETHALGGRLPQHHRAVWQAAGLLKLHPEVCADLVPIYQRADMTATGKALLLDILVAAGHDKAQDAMRTMLSGDDQTTRDFGLHLQRFSLIRQPDSESIDFLEALAEADHNPHLQRGARVALGAAAAHLQSTDPAHARVIAHRLAHRLNATHDPVEAAATLMALGNTRQAEQADSIVEQLHAADADVRIAAADALANIHAPAAQHGLIDALHDPVAGVRRMALIRLADQPLNAAALRRLPERLRTAPFHHTELQTVLQTVSILAERHGADALAPAIHALRSRPDLARRIHNRLRGMPPG